MQDAGKIIAGIVIFLGLLSIPIWVTQAAGNASEVPELKIDMDVVNAFVAENYPDMDYDGECIEETNYMRLNHMKILMDWQKWVMRADADKSQRNNTVKSSEGEDLYYISETDGTEWEMSLMDTCLGCHTDVQNFCDQCHEYTATQPGCWFCHFDPADPSSTGA